MKRSPVAALALFLLVGSAAAAAAAPAADDAALRTQCANETDSSIPLDQKVSACGALIAAGRLGHDELALTYARRADGYAWSRDFASAVADYDKALALYGTAIKDDRHKRILNARGYAYSGQQRFARAIQDFDRAIAIDPAYAAAYAGRGQAYDYLGLGARALEDFDNAIAHQAGFVTAYLGRGTVDVRADEIPRALSALDFAIRAGTPEPAAYYYRGLARFAAGQFEAALQDLDLAVTLAPAEAPLREARDRVRVARATLAQRLAAAPPSAPVEAPAGGLVRSRAVGQSHDCGELYPVMSRRLRESGDVLVSYDVDATGVIGGVILLKSSGFDRLDRAAVACVSGLWRNTPAMQDGTPVASPGHQAIVRFFNISPPLKADAFLERGSARAQLGDYAGAMADLDYALQLDPKTPGAFYARGLVDQVTGHLERAAADYAAALALKPGDRDAADARDLAAFERTAPKAGEAPAKPL